MASSKVARVPSRRLGGFEFLYHAYESVGGTNFVVIVEIEGSVVIDTLQRALDFVQSRHPLLRARVLGAGGAGARFVCDCDHKIPLEVSSVADDSWVVIAEKEMIAPFLLDEGPLVRCRLLRYSGTKNVLLIVFNHIIADGRSAANFVQGLIFTLAEMDRGGAPRVGSRSLAGPVEDYLPARYRGVNGILNLAPYLSRRLIRRFRRGKLWDFPVVKGSGSDRVRIGRILPYRLGKGSVERLAEACLAKGTTVHGALCAAQLLGICEVFDIQHGESDDSLCISSAIDVREILAPPTRKDFGFYIGSIQAVYSMSTFRNFWDLAVEVRNRIVRGIELGEPLAGVSLLGLIAGLVRRSSRAARRYCASGGGSAASWFVPPHSMLSNLGSFDTERHFGSFSIEAAHGATVGPPHWPFGSVVATYNDVLFWNFIYIEGEVERDVALRIADVSLDILRSSILLLS